ncbi:hypothetical protein COY23_04190 [bacterium (Candidatus Torokbacteria) CG_4_10_14_0_2_um_filter_35_8]|nr:MAG: hypothetical protein COY23_04190 [bacterium (Candidatus Torokbacteria) CG_4_10_14_0_2_um_filter_35_8]
MKKQKDKNIRIENWSDKTIYQEIKTILRNKDKGRLLDIGCGPGFFLNYIQNLEFKSLSGLDKSRRIFILKDKNIDFYEQDLNKLLKIRKKFDIITAIEVIEHLENPHKFIRDCKKLLKKKGILIISAPNITSYESRLLFLLTGRFFNFLPSSIKKSGHTNPISLWEMEEILKKCNFQIKQTKGTKIHPFNTKYNPFLNLLANLIIIFIPLAMFMGNWGFGHKGKRIKISRHYIIEAVSS